MKTRVLFAIVGLIFIILGLYVFPPIVLEIALALLCALATFELLGSTKLVHNHLYLVCCVIVSFLYAVSQLFPEGIQAWFVPLLRVIFVVVSFGFLLKYHEKMRFQEIACGYIGAFLLPYLLLSLLRIFQMPYGHYLVLLPLVAAWGSDSFALFAGMAFGKQPLAPVISPKKTVEGSIGGIVGATVLMLIVVFLFNTLVDNSISYIGAALLGALGAAIGQLGDLSFSIVKRQTGIKDYGTIFPGHGGVLDRFDSVVFVAPVAELILWAFTRA